MRFWHISGACFVARDGTTTFKAQLAAASVFGIERLYTLLRNVDMCWASGMFIALEKGSTLTSTHFLNMMRNDQLAALKLRETPLRLSHSYESCFVGNFVSSKIEWVSCKLHMHKGGGLLVLAMCLQIMFVLPTDVMIQRQVQLSICIDGRWIVIF